MASGAPNKYKQHHSTSLARFLIAALMSRLSALAIAPPSPRATSTTMQEMTIIHLLYRYTNNEGKGTTVSLNTKERSTNGDAPKTKPPRFGWHVYSAASWGWAHGRKRMSSGYDLPWARARASCTFFHNLCTFAFVQKHSEALFDFTDAITIKCAAL